MKRWGYRNTIDGFWATQPNEMLAALVKQSDFAIEESQRDAWVKQIALLQKSLKTFEGTILLEYTIPRMGRRVDAVALINHIVFVLEFKINCKAYHQADVDQVWDYALDLTNFHEGSHDRWISPVLVATEAPDIAIEPSTTDHRDKTLVPIRTNADGLAHTITTVLAFAEDAPLDPDTWASGRYRPTPTIIEAATALYNQHSVQDISRSDAGAINLRDTSRCITDVIRKARDEFRKAICFVTGVPGAGNTHPDLTFR